MFKNPEGSKEWLGEVALYDPRLARALLCPDMVGNVTLRDRILDGLGWEVINIKACFQSGEANQSLQAEISDGYLGSDVWVKKVVYTVRRPNAFAGSIFKAQSDHFNKLNPNISFTLNIKSYCDYLISPSATPLENIEQIFECVCPQGLVLKYGAQILASFTNCRPLAEDEIPTEVVITMHGIRLRMGVYDCQLVDAISALKSVGICLDGGCHAEE